MRNLVDLVCFLGTLFYMPILFLFDLFVVLPKYHEIGSGIYIFTWLVSVFLLINVLGNMFACMLVNTSIHTTKIEPPEDAAKLELWHMCNTCNMLVPPRSWHCEICNTCMLKRDHHCRFVGGCVGHRNHRYFFYFVLYSFIAATYAVIYNSIFIWYSHAEFYFTWFTIVKLFLPIFMFITNPLYVNVYLLVYLLNIIGFAMTLGMVIYHAPIISKGAVSFEGVDTKYNVGLMYNIKMVLGKRWYLTWLSPWLKSELPHNGVDWKTTLNSKPYI